MGKLLPLLSACVVLLGSPARADLCVSVQDTATTAETKNDVDFYETLFPDSQYHGSRKWNEFVVQCNRQRDTKGNEIGRATAESGDNPDKQLLRSRSLDPKVIRGHFNFFGTIVTQLKYVYVLGKEDGVWTMIIPYRPILNELVADRVDFYVGYRNVDTRTGAVSAVSQDGHAWQLYDAAQVERRPNPATGLPSLSLRPSAQPIATTLCSGSTYFPGDAGKYDGKSDANAYKRDKENKFVSTGKIQYRYKDQDWLSDGCRVDENRDLYWLDPTSNHVVPVKPQDWILDNFVRTAESYWSIPGTFQLKLLLKSRNEFAFQPSTLALLRDDDHLTVRFATQFLPYHYNQMYKSNIIQFNNFSTMTTDGTYWHEVGHAFGLDDEYGGEKKGVPKENSCENAKYAAFSPTTYQMCEAGADEVRTIYHYIAASRYVTKQAECRGDGDCDQAEYCDKGTVTVGKNQCLPKKADNAACDLVDGGRQCRSGRCNLGRCYTPGSVAMGGACYLDAACQAGKCSAIDGARGTCVCASDGDCGAGMWCNAGLDLATNSCLALKADGEACDVVGGGHQCKGGRCGLGRCYTQGAVAMGGTCYVDAACGAGKCSSVDGTRGTCVCQRDGDCGAGMWCDAGLDTKLNACRAKLAEGATCGKLGSFGNDHKCRSGQCSGAPFYKCK